MISIDGDFKLLTSVNIIAIAFMAGVYIQTIKTLKATVEKQETESEKRVKELKKYLLEKIEDIKIHFIENLNELSKKQDKHNKVIERTYALEKEQGIQSEQIKVINHRIEDLERVNK